MLQVVFDTQPYMLLWYKFFKNKIILKIWKTAVLQDPVDCGVYMECLIPCNTLPFAMLCKTFFKRTSGLGAITWTWVKLKSDFASVSYIFPCQQLKYTNEISCKIQVVLDIFVSWFSYVLFSHMMLIFYRC